MLFWRQFFSVPKCEATRTNRTQNFHVYFVFCAVIFFFYINFHRIFMFILYDHLAFFLNIFLKIATDYKRNFHRTFLVRCLSGARLVSERHCYENARLKISIGITYLNLKFNFVCECVHGFKCVLSKCLLRRSTEKCVQKKTFVHALTIPVTRFSTWHQWCP